MLLIAIPKSASTSLMKTLGKLHKMPAKQIVFPEQSSPPGYGILWRFHGDIRQIDSDQAKLFAINREIYKQHIPPTENNRKLLSGQKKVLLLRPPEEIISAYFRGVQKNVHNPLPGFERIKTREEWVKRAESLGLLSDLKDFYDVWLNDDSDKLVVTFDELVGDCTQVIQKIERYWSLPVTTEHVELDRKRYSRISPVRAFFVNRIYKGSRAIARSALRKLKKPGR